MAHRKPTTPRIAAENVPDDRLQLALDAGEMGSFIWHVHEDRCEADARMLEHFGLEDPAALNLVSAVGRLIHPDDRKRYAQAAAHAVDPAGTGELREDIRILHADGAERWITVFGRTSFVGDPPVALRMAGLTADCTERKRAEVALQESERRLRDSDLRKDEYLAMLGHELRNPLTAIKGGLQLLQSDHVQEATRQATLPLVASQVLHMERLIEDTLNVARITRGKIAMRLERSALQPILEEAVLMTEAQMRSHGCQLSVRLAAEPIILCADTARLVQVFSNLLSNAARYSGGEGCQIELVAQQEGENAVIRLRDHGMGMDADLLPRIFDPFVQSPDSRKRSEGGLGLGLSVVRQLVELHGGSTEAFSEGPGLGSEFVVRLPIEGRPS